MNMFLFEGRAYWKSTLIWTFSLVGLVVLFLSLFPSFAQEAEGFKRLLEGFPESLRLALGMAVNIFGSILGFYSYIFLYISLCGAIQAMNLGLSTLSKETREKTADFLLTKPVSRMEIITSKLLAAFASLVFTNIIYGIVATIMASFVKVEAYSTKIFFMITLTLFFLQLMFLALGIFLSAVIPKVKSVLSISLSVVFGLFMVGAVASSTGDDALRYLSPFKYFDLSYIIQHARYELSYLIVGLTFIVLAIVASYIIYIKKDIHTV